jgi:hypothetical protein
MKNGVIGSFFIEELTVTCDIIFWLLLRPLFASFPCWNISQLHDAPYHFSLHVHVFLDRNFPDRWIGRWESHSLDHFFWRFVKRIVYSEKCKIE